jgi:hypothetical protein
MFLRREPSLISKKEKVFESLRVLTQPLMRTGMSVLDEESKNLIFDRSILLSGPKKVYENNRVERETPKLRQIHGHIVKTTVSFDEQHNRFVKAVACHSLFKILDIGNRYFINGVDDIAL